MQRRYLEALHDWWDPASEFHVEGANPVSPAYGGRAVEHDLLTVWTWDARPYPLFPYATEIWSDGPNWEFGHWLNGRMGVATLDRLAATIADDYGIGFLDASALEGIVGGYVLDRPMSARDALEPLMRAFAFDAVESGGALRLTHRGGAAVAAIGPDDLTITGSEEPLERRRTQEGELPARVAVRYLDTATDHRPAAVGARRTGAVAGGDMVLDLPAAVDRGIAQKAAEVVLQDAWTGRETAAFALPPSRMALEPGDTVLLDGGGGARAMLLTEIAAGLERRVEARAVDRRDYRAGRGPAREGVVRATPATGAPLVAVIEAPALPGVGPALHFAAFADPWPGAVEVFVERPSGTHEPVGVIGAPTAMGALAGPLAPGPVWRWDRGSAVEVEIGGGALVAAPEADVLEGVNAAAVLSANGEWEIVQFAGAELVAPGRYRLTDLLRGQAGTEPAAFAGAGAGATFVVLDDTLMPVPLGVAGLGAERTYRFVPAGAGLADDATVAVTITPQGIAWRPWSPVHVRAARAGGTIEVTWTRRSRDPAADSWTIEPPLGEAEERYEVELHDGEAVVAAASVTEPAWTVDDAPDGPLTVRVWQMGMLGRGQVGEGVV